MIPPSPFLSHLLIDQSECMSCISKWCPKVLSGSTTLVCLPPTSPRLLRLRTFLLRKETPFTASENSAIFVQDLFFFRCCFNGLANGSGQQIAKSHGEFPCEENETFCPLMFQ